MGLTLVITGEHYVSDLLLGGVYAFLVHFAWNHIERWWEGRKAPSEPETSDLSPQFEGPPLA
jgi:hypothetical protein